MRPATVYTKYSKAEFTLFFSFVPKLFSSLGVPISLDSLKGNKTVTSNKQGTTRSL